VKTIFLLFIFLGCSAMPTTTPLKQGKSVYSYSDVSGSFYLQREVKTVKQKVITRNILLDKVAGQKVLEKSVMVSQLGTVNDNDKRMLALRPVASEFSVWLEGKKYSSQMLLSPRKKAMVVKLDSPESKWNGTEEVPFPKGKYFCFFSQIPECLHQLQLLKLAMKNPNKSYEFFVIWESYPYVQEQLTGVGQTLFANAELKFEGTMQNQLRFEVEADGQIILYHFSKSFDLVKIAWIAQGITVVPPGESDIQHEDQ